VVELGKDLANGCGISIGKLTFVKSEYVIFSS